MELVNKNGIGIIDPSTNGKAKNLEPGSSYTFTIRASGTIDVSDINSITLTQRILPDYEEFKEQIIYQK